jgi:hypothetical protein
MLLGTHGIVMAASAGTVAGAWTTEGPATFRHLNLSVLAAVIRYTMPVAIRYARRNNPQLRYERNERELSAGWDSLLQR